MNANMAAAAAAAFEWDCDCGWELDLETGVPPPPPLFDLPPPPLPPSLQPAPELCSSASAHPLGLETCQAFLISDAEYREPAKVADWMPMVFASAATLTIIFIAVVIWRYKKQKEQQHQKSLLRCQQKTLNGAGVMDGVPPLLQGLGDHQVTRMGDHCVDDDDDDDADDDDGVFYDELISYPTHFRAVTRPPAYEMKDVLFKSPASPCHCTTHPLLGGVGTRVQPHYVSSPYQAGSGGSHSPPTSSTPTADADCSWTAEPVYEELPSGPDDDVRYPRDGRQRNGSANTHNSARTGRGGSVVHKPSKASTNSSGQWSDEPCETDFFIPPTTWYRQPQSSSAQHSLIRGQLTTQGPVRQGRGGIRAAWRELEQPGAQPQPQQVNAASGSLQAAANNHAGRKKRKVKSTRSDSAQSVPLDEQPLHAESPILHYHSTGLYRGKCPPEEPPFAANGDGHSPARDDPAPLPPVPPVVAQQNDTPTKTLPRYYYYSESDDYGVNSPKRTLSSIRRNNQRHLARNQRTLQQPRSPTSDNLV